MKINRISPPKVLIVGAGPTGLTAAIELARQGIVPDVIDRKDDGSTLSRAVGIMPRSLDILAPSGVSARLLKEGVKVRTMCAYQGQRKVVTIPLYGVHPRQDFGLALAQDRTEAAMRDALVHYGGSVQYGIELASLTQDPHSVVVLMRDGTRRTYDYVIGADGTRSATRQALGIDFVGYDLPEIWSIADVDAVNWKHADELTFCLLNEGRIVVVAPLETERYRVIANTSNALESLPLSMEVTNIRRASEFRISVRQVTDYRLGRVFLAGDAAHCHSPAGGRGMNLGIADAAELARRLVTDQLEGYTASRHAEGAATIGESERARRWLTASNPFVRVATSVGFSLLNIMPSLKRPIAQSFLGA